MDDSAVTAVRIRTDGAAAADWYTDSNIGCTPLAGWSQCAIWNA